MSICEDISRRDFVRHLGLMGVAGVGAGALLSACGGGNASSGQEGVQTASTEEAAEVTITPVGNEMRYEKTEFIVRPGKKVHLIFDNTATSPAMQHNVVVLNSNDDAVVERVGEGGLQAGSANDYVPDDPAVLANTPVAPPGETVEVTFTAPEEPGTYRYICTFPGHWATMQGTMRVTGNAA